MRRVFPMPLALLNRITGAPAPFQINSPTTPALLEGNVSTELREDPNRISGVQRSRLAPMGEAELARRIASCSPRTPFG